jgi:phage-related baseplate assembly protein
MPRGKAELSIAKLQNYLNVQRAKRQTILREKKKLLKAMRKLDAQLAQLDGQHVAPTGKAGRGGNSTRLVDVMVEVMSKSGDGMTIQQIIDGVEKAGYISASDNFRSIINQALIRERKRFVKLQRGLYAVKK